MEIIKILTNFPTKMVFIIPEKARIIWPPGIILKTKIMKSFI